MSSGHCTPCEVASCQCTPRIAALSISCDKHVNFIHVHRMSLKARDMHTMKLHHNTRLAMLSAYNGSLILKLPSQALPLISHIKDVQTSN